MPDDSTSAFEELVRVLEEALQAGVPSVGLEYKDRDLMVFHQLGPVSVGATRIPKDLHRAVIAELIKRAGLNRKSRGKMQVYLCGQDYEATVEKYDSFGEWAYNLTLRERKQKAKKPPTT